MRTYFGAILLLGLLSLSACGGGGDSGGGSSTPAPTTTYTIGGTISGLSGSGLVLQNNGAANLTVTGNTFAFTTAVNSGAAYAVTVLTQPSGPAQSCTVANGSGTVSAANVTNVSITCTTTTPTTFTVGGTITGLTGAGLVLRLNGANNLTVAANGTFTFGTTLPTGTAYAVAVLSQPTGPTQICAVTSGSGTVAAANITNVAISCTTIAPGTFTVGGTISGLAGAGLVLRLNVIGVGDLSVISNGTFTFGTSLTTGTGYAVTVVTQPTGPAQTCVVANGTGTVAASSITNVTVTCTTNVSGTFSIGGTVTGLSGTGLLLRLNGANNLTIAANGSFAFSGALASGTAYTVTVLTQPTTPGQTCIVGNGSGTVSNANVTNVVVTCTTNSYTIGGTVSGLAGTGLVLQNNAGNNLAISANGAFAFGTSVLSGAAYAVTVLTQPGGPAQSCTVARRSGTVGASNITNVSVVCTTLQAAVIGSSFAGSPAFSFDADGAVGPSHYAEITNNGLRVTSLADGTVVYNISLVEFWSHKVGIAFTSICCDSHIEYDHATGRWFAITTALADVSGQNSSFFVGVSDTSDPSAGWKGLVIDADPSHLRWADYPRMGMDAAAIYISYNMIRFAGTPTSGVGLVVLPKSDLTGASPVATHLSRLTYVYPASGGTLVISPSDLYPFADPQIDYLGTASDGLLTGYQQPVGVPSGNGYAWGMGLYYQKMTAQASGAAALIPSVWTGLFNFSSSINPPPQPFYPADAGRQPGTNERLGFNTGNNNIRVGDSLYTVQSATVRGRGGIVWARFQPSTNIMVDAGFIGDDTHDHLDPSIGANANGDVVITYTRTSPTEYASLYCSVGRQDSSGMLVFGLPTLLRAGTDIYDESGPQFPSGGARYSDFSSAVTTHPSNPSHFWVSGAYVSGRNQASTWISEIIVQ